MSDMGDATVAYLNQLREETMRLAWGEEASPEDRRRIVSAAVIFGRQFEERISGRPVGDGEEETRRLLMDLMNRVVREFAAREGVETDEAAGFLGEVGTRDRVLEFSEVLDAHAESGRPLDELLREAVEARRERAFRARRGPG
ncbi:hypothetical protein GBA63_01555 [Rubrobacter tropicus]|uniref:Uncharacterized protein n=2 Tax=Rubrobacter tropicus TaxID=2653851 RepID=A0A6G8Q551_9ACTN|nr:hypothetical protein GBA63_01555 [Rubrobacter tropicus]